VFIVSQDFVFFVVARVLANGYLVWWKIGIDR